MKKHGTLLRDRLMPVQLLWTSNVVTQAALAGSALASAKLLKATDARLMQLLGTSTFQDVHYLADVAAVALAVRQERLGCGDAAAAEVQLPAVKFGESPSVDKAAALLDRFKPSMLLAARKGDLDALNLVVYCARMQSAVNRFGRLPPTVAAPVEQDVETALLQAIRRYSDQCQFKATGDAYLHAVMKLRLPAWVLSALPAGATPFPVASRIMTVGANDAIRPLIDGGAAPLMKDLASAHAADESKAEAFAVAACLISEMAGAAKLLVNDALALAPLDEPRPFVVGDFGMIASRCFGVVHGRQLIVAESPLTVICTWLKLSTPKSLEAKLWQAATAPPDAMPPSNPFAKYFL